jgi:hypothetical protein
MSGCLKNRKKKDDYFSPGGIFIGIRRQFLPSRNQIFKSRRSRKTLWILVKSFRRWEVIVCRVWRVKEFKNGILVFIDPSYKGSMIKNWGSARLWIPKEKECEAGVLTDWK